MKYNISLSDFYGYSQLALQAARGITNLVEEMHLTVAPALGLLGKPAPRRTGGITGLVYRSIHTCYDLAGAGMDLALGGVMPFTEEPRRTPDRSIVLAALNGVWGDYLEASANPLAIKMSFRHEANALELEKPAIKAALPHATGKVALFVHGLCMDDLSWLRAGHDHGAALARDLGYTPLYLHYNSGRHVSTNGRELAGLLDALVAAWPEPVQDLAIIGHSMGGLVARSAYYYADLAGRAWPSLVRKMIFLGTPHHGTALEQVGNWTGATLAGLPFTAPFRRLGTQRSAGITDLRYGNLIDDDWEGLDRFAVGPDNRRPVALDARVQCLFIGATLGADIGSSACRLLGDGLVPLDSALGLHKDRDHRLSLSPAQRWTINNTGHADLLSRPQVYVKLKEWLRSTSTARPESTDPGPQARY